MLSYPVVRAVRAAKAVIVYLYYFNSLSRVRRS